MYAQLPIANQKHPLVTFCIVTCKLVARDRQTDGRTDTWQCLMFHYVKGA